MSVAVDVARRTTAFHRHGCRVAAERATGIGNSAFVSPRRRGGTRESVICIVRAGDA
jgi:hypothetical protein